MLSQSREVIVIERLRRPKQSNHIFCSIRAFTQLELMRAEELIENWYEVQRNSVPSDGSVVHHGTPHRNLGQPHKINFPCQCKSYLNPLTEVSMLIPISAGGWRITPPPNFTTWCTNNKSSNVQMNIPVGVPGQRGCCAKRCRSGKKGSYPISRTHRMV